MTDHHDDPDKTRPPWPTGRKAVVEVLGCLVPYSEDQPALVTGANSTALMLPIFSTRLRLVVFMERAGIPYDKVREITDVVTLRADLERANIGLAHDPYFLENGHVRWKEIERLS